MKNLPKTDIEYLTHHWPVVTGCSFGCGYCWARHGVEVVGRHAMHGTREAFDADADGEEIQVKIPIPFSRPILHPDRLDLPLRRKKPARIGVCFTGDLFGPEVPGHIIASVRHSMELSPWHQFFLLTKRAERLREYHNKNLGLPDYLPRTIHPNVWLGVSVTTQAEADERIPLLLATPAAHRWVSIEPCFSSIDLSKWLHTRRNSHDRKGSEVLGSGCDGLVFGGQQWEDLAPREASGRRCDIFDMEESAGASGEECSPEGKLPEGDVYPRRAAVLRGRSQNIVDGRKPTMDTSRDGDQSYRRGQDEPGPRELGACYEVGERDPRGQGDRPKAEGPARGEECGGTAHRSAGTGNAGAVAGKVHDPKGDRGAVRREAIHGQQRRQPAQLETPGLDLVVVGSIDRPSPRFPAPRREWIDSIVEQCRAAGVPVWVKRNAMLRFPERNPRVRDPEKVYSEPTWPQELPA